MANLETIANLAEITTALLAAIASVWYWWDQHRKRITLENYLKDEKLANPDNRRHTTLHLMTRVRLTQDEILKASFESSHIARRVHVNDDTHLADDLLFEYKD